MAEKKELRKQYRQYRDKMPEDRRASLSEKICAQILGSDLFRDAQYLYAYSPLGSEVDVRPVVEAAWREGKSVAFPKVSGEEMHFFEVTDFGQLEEGAFGILEPTDGCLLVDWRKERKASSGRTSAGRLLVLVPGVAFDRQGHRLGYGKGYYDRHFSACAGIPDKITLLGAAYACQIAEELPAKEHDLTMPYLATEDRLLCL